MFCRNTRVQNYEPIIIISKCLPNFLKVHKKIFMLCFSFWLTCTLYFYWRGGIGLKEAFDNDEFFEFRITKYVIDNSKCRMPDLNIWNYGAKSWFANVSARRRDEDISLVNMKRRGSRVFLVMTPYCSNKGIRPTCTVCHVEPVNYGAPDSEIQITNCTVIPDEIEMQVCVVVVTCDIPGDIVQEIPEDSYIDVLANYVWSDTQKKRNLSKHKSVTTTKPFNVLMIGIDSISKQNIRRTMPRTYDYLRSHDWTQYVAYNKIGENTLPNLYGILTGNDIEMFNHTIFDSANFIWKYYRKLGYVTAYAEDWRAINTFNSYHDGFFKQPVDFYFRPYTIAMEQLKISRIAEMPFYTGSRITAERIYQLATELPLACEGQPYFGFFWTSSASHEHPNLPQLVDNLMLEVFNKLKAENVFNDTIIIFLSDHGFRLGGIRKTLHGWYEDKMPFIFFWIPEIFTLQHPRAYKNFLTNSRKLTSSYDLYMTLQDILVLSRLDYKVSSSSACPSCQSFFRKMPEQRSCAEAGIAEEFCSCIGYEYIDARSTIAKEIAEYVVKETMNIIETYGSESDKCRVLRFGSILQIRKRSLSLASNGTLFLIMVQTRPMTSLEAIVAVTMQKGGSQNLKIIGKIQRIDLYRQTGACTDIKELKKFCYCIF